MDIDKTQTTPLHPQSDGMVERYNRIILNSLSHLFWGINKTGIWNYLCSCSLTEVPSMKPPASQRPKCSSAGNYVFSVIFFLFGRPPDTSSSPVDYVDLQARLDDVRVCPKPDRDCERQDEDQVKYESYRTCNSRRRQSLVLEPKAK